MKKVVYAANKQLVDGILAFFSRENWFGDTTKVYVSDSESSLLAYDFNPIGIPNASEVTLLATPGDWEEVILSFQSLLHAKKDKWVHVTVSVNSGSNSQWFQDNGYRLLVNQGTTNRFQKVLNKERMREYKKTYVDTLNLV